MTVAHMFLQMVLSLEHLVLVDTGACVARMNIIRMLYSMPQKGITARVHLSATYFLASPSFVLRALAVLVEAL